MTPEGHTKTPLVTAMCDAIRRIPRGRVSTYGAIAKAAGYPRCARQVGRVLKQAGGLPWHRVVGSGGRISLCGEAALERLRSQSGIDDASCWRPKGSTAKAGGWT